MSRVMEGKTCLVTGASDGIGYVAAHELARKGASVIVVGRNASKTHGAVMRIIDETGNDDVRYFIADLSSQSAVRKMAGQVKESTSRLDVLLNNAGAFFLSRQSSIDGLEMTFALNHMGYFLLTSQLLDLLKKSAPARIINVSSNSHTTPGRFRLEDLPKPSSNRGYRAYSRSKLCNILFTYELSRRLEGTGITANALHPGLVRTNIARNNGPIGRILNFFMGVSGKEVEQGAKKLVYLAASSEVEEVTGKYYVDCRPVSSSKLSYDPKLAEGLWELSERLTTINGSSG